jgi:uncharacterized protein
MEQSISSINDTMADSAGSIAAIIALSLLVVGGLNWALVGLFDVDLIAAVLGPSSAESRIAYVLIGVAAVYGLTFFPRLARRI